MANTATKMRFVRCPKCFKLLPEFAHVPMYQCGGCGAILRAKGCNVTNESSTLISSETDSSQCSSGNGASNNASITPRSMEDSSDVASIGIAGRDSNDANLQTKSEYSCSEKEKEAKSLDFSERGSDISRPNDKLEEAQSDCFGHSVASEKEMPSLISSTADSSDDGPRDRFRDKHRLMSRRTFRYEWSSGSSCSGVKDGEDDEDYRQKSMPSLGSESFYSVRSTIRHENGVPLRSLSKDLSDSMRLKNLNHKRAELQILVDELKEQLGGMHKLKQEKKQIRQSQIIHRWPQQHQSSEKARPCKRFCLPVSGGAPFVVCYKCFEVLHMPADFLISTRRLNRLKCGACSETLALRFPAKAHEVPRACAEDGNYSEDPISFSVEYGISFAESGSMGISSDRNQDDKGPALPLHRLMGYPSARQLLH